MTWLCFSSAVQLQPRRQGLDSSHCHLHLPLSLRLRSSDIFLTEGQRNPPECRSCRYGSLLHGVADAMTPVPLTLADIPAHCIANDVLGEWRFKLGAPVDAASVSLACKQLDPLPYETYITLSAPDRAVDESGNAGTWTMVYDQGFEISIPDRQDPSKQKIYFHFMSYTQSGPNVTTDCGKSLDGYGWVHDAPQAGQPPENWQCYTAGKTSGSSLRRYQAAAHGPGRLLGVPRHEAWLENMPRAVRDDRPDAIKYAGCRPLSTGATRRQARPTATEPMRDQLTCGSCFAFTGTSMLAAEPASRTRP